jgi:dTDP-4-dehydrorhamnose 3,5-epimerase
VDGRTKIKRTLMQHKLTPIEGCYELIPRVFEDERGSFKECFKNSSLKPILGEAPVFVQENESLSKYGALRGLHYQKGSHAQAKLIRVVQGRVLDVVVDLRKQSPSFGTHFTIELSSDGGNQLFIPRGCAHGFVVLSETAKITYLCDNEYHPESEAGILYSDHHLGIDWKIDFSELIISKKDLELPLFNEISYE